MKAQINEGCRRQWFIGENNPLHQTDVLDERGDLIARVASSRQDALLIAAAPALQEAARAVIEHWQVGDLAGAVRALARAVDKSAGR